VKSAAEHVQQIEDALCSGRLVNARMHVRERDKEQGKAAVNEFWRRLTAGDVVSIEDTAHQFIDDIESGAWKAPA